MEDEGCSKIGEAHSRYKTNKVVIQFASFKELHTSLIYQNIELLGIIFVFFVFLVIPNLNHHEWKPTFYGASTRCVVHKLLAENYSCTAEQLVFAAAVSLYSHSTQAAQCLTSSLLSSKNGFSRAFRDFLAFKLLSWRGRPSFRKRYNFLHDHDVISTWTAIILRARLHFPRKTRRSCLQWPRVSNFVFSSKFAAPFWEFRCSENSTTWRDCNTAFSDGQRLCMRYQLYTFRGSPWLVELWR